MPPKTKSQRQLSESLFKARDEKKKRESGEGKSSDVENQPGVGDDIREISELAQMSDDALNTEDESIDPTFDLDSSIKVDYNHMMESFCEDWVLQLERDDKVSLGLFFIFPAVQSSWIRRDRIS